MNIPYVMKKCSKCGEWLVASSVNFNKRKDGKYGLRAECKKCKVEYERQRRRGIVEHKIELPYGFKKCTKCGEILPATTEYFHKEKRGKYGLRGQCKKCKAKYQQENKEAIAEYDKRYREQNKEAIAEYNRQRYQDNKEAILERQKKYQQENKEAIAEYGKQYYQENKEAILERDKRYREQNKEARKEYIKQYYQDNKEALAERGKQYRQSPKGQVVAFNRHNRRRAKEENQGKGITTEQWLECMSFFNWQCAYSGEVLTKETRSLDHIVPLNKGGANEIWNVIPMIKSLNSSKNDKNMLEWYTEQPYFSQERLNKIYEWQQYAYNKWAIDTEAQ